MKTKKTQRTAKIIFLALLAFIPVYISRFAVRADVRDTRAGTAIYSTNTTLIFSNWANVLYTNYGTNDLSEIVKAIYGFTNIGSNFMGSIFTNYPSQEQFYYFGWTNEGNTNVDFNFTFAKEIISNYDGIEPVGGDWTVAVTKKDDMSNNFFTSAFPAIAVSNVAEDSGIDFYIRILSPTTAVNATGYRIRLTNYFNDPESNGIYRGTNDWYYGGTNYFTSTFDYVIKAPDMKVYKTMEITNITGVTGTTINATSIIPGSVITYTIHYTNKGDAEAAGLFFTEYLPNLQSAGGVRYVDYISGSLSFSGDPVLTPVGNVWYNTNVGGGGTFVSHGSYDPTANSGAVNTNVDAFQFRFSGTGLAEKKGGKIIYKVQVR